MGIEAVIGLALAAAGAGTSIAAASQSRSDMNKQVVKSLQQQKAFQEQASPIFNKSLEEGSPETARANEGLGEVAARAMYDRRGPSPGTSPLPVDSARLASIVGQGKSVAARGQGLQETAFQRWLKNQEASRGLGVVSNLAQSSAGNTGILTQLAGNQSANMAGIGSLLSTAGSLAAIYGGINRGRAAAPTMTPATTTSWPKGVA